MVMVGISMVVSVIAINLSQKPQARPVPWVIMRLHTGYLAFILGLPTTKVNIFFVCLNLYVHNKLV